MRFAAVVFDMDGVLVDSEPMHVDAMRRLLTPYGIPYTDEENAEFFGFTDPEVFRVLRARYGLEPDDQALTRRRAALLVELTRQRTVPMPGVPDVPKALHGLGYRLAVASSSALDVIGVTVDEVLEVYRDPVRAAARRHGWKYGGVRLLKRGALVSPLAAPRARVRVADLLP